MPSYRWAQRAMVAVNGNARSCRRVGGRWESGASHRRTAASETSAYGTSRSVALIITLGATVLTLLGFSAAPKVGGAAFTAPAEHALDQSGRRRADINVLSNVAHSND